MSDVLGGLGVALLAIIFAIAIVVLVSSIWSYNQTRRDKQAGIIGRAAVQSLGRAAST